MYILQGSDNFLLKFYIYEYNLIDELVKMWNNECQSETFHP